MICQLNTSLDKPELTIEYLFETIQSFENSENIPIRRGLPQNLQK
jgi:hypothetical protein